MPVDVNELAAIRLTYATFADGQTKVLKDNQRTSKQPNGNVGGNYTGKTVFQLVSKTIGSRLTGKQSTLPKTDAKGTLPFETLS